MLRLDFEQLIMEMVFEVGYEKLTPATVAYYLRIPIKAAENALDELVRDGILELESDDGGRLFYVLPMADTPQEVLHQTILRRAHRGLGSEYTAAEIRGEDPHEAEKKEREEKERLRRALQAEARQQ